MNMAIFKFFGRPSGQWEMCITLWNLEINVWKQAMEDGCYWHWSFYLKTA